MSALDTAIMDILNDMRLLKNKVDRIATRDAAGGYWVSMPSFTGLPPFAATSAAHLVAVPRDLTIRKLSIATFSNAPNNAGNHWEVQLADSAGNIMMVAQTLQADTAGVWQFHTYTTFAISAVVAATSIYLVINVNKVGAPGTIYTGNPVLFFT